MAERSTQIVHGAVHICNASVCTMLHSIVRYGTTLQTHTYLQSIYKCPDPHNIHGIVLNRRTALHTLLETVAT